MATPNAPVPVLSDDLQAVIGLAIVDGAFQRALLDDPPKALAGFEMAARDRQAAGAIRGAESLAEYAIRLEQRLGRSEERGRVAVGRAPAQGRPRAKAAS